jgi:hypothetical protein
VIRLPSWAIVLVGGIAVLALTLLISVDPKVFGLKRPSQAGLKRAEPCRARSPVKRVRIAVVGLRRARAKPHSRSSSMSPLATRFERSHRFVLDSDFEKSGRSKEII